MRLVDGVPVRGDRTRLLVASVVAAALLAVSACTAGDRDAPAACPTSRPAPEGPVELASSTDHYQLTAAHRPWNVPPRAADGVLCGVALSGWGIADDIDLGVGDELPLDEQGTRLVVLGVRASGQRADAGAGGPDPFVVDVAVRYPDPPTGACAATDEAPAGGVGQVVTQTVRAQTADGGPAWPLLASDGCAVSLDQEWSDESALLAWLRVGEPLTEPVGALGAGSRLLSVRPAPGVDGATQFEVRTWVAPVAP